MRAISIYIKKNLRIQVYDVDNDDEAISPNVIPSQRRRKGS